MNLINLENDITSSMKNGNQIRLSVLRMLLNNIKLSAKADGNRAASDNDIIPSCKKLIKQIDETKSFLSDMDVRHSSLDAEKSILAEYLPMQLSHDKLKELVKQYSIRAPEGKAAIGYIMKQLKDNHEGSYDSKHAMEIISGRA